MHRLGAAIRVCRATSIEVEASDSTCNVGDPPLALPLAEQCVKGQFQTVEHELLLLWLQAKVPLDIQASLATLGSTSLDMFR